MKIQVKQPEIEAALKLFIEQQGISLTGKSVEINFTAGRRGSGLTADVDIQGTAELPKPTGVTPRGGVAWGGKGEANVAENTADETPDQVFADDEEEVEESPKEERKGSLFG